MAGDLQDLVAWQAAVTLAIDVVSAARKIHGVGAMAAADQLVRSAESVPANIAEGYGRGFGRDGARFLRMARSSAVELESHLWIARGTARIPAEDADAMIARTRRVRALLRGLLRHYESPR